MDKPILRIVVIIALIAVAAVVVLYLAKQCSNPPAKATGEWNGEPATLIESHKGKVLLLLVGMEGCPGTAAITEILKDYCDKKVEGVSIVRLDVPPPGQKLEETLEAPLPFAYGVDKDRIVAKKLEFFYYPTFYILGKESDVRFSGDCDKESLDKMVQQILNEKLGDEKHVFTPPMPAEGTIAPAFSGKDLGGIDVTLDSLKGEKATALIFARTDCPFSKTAIPGMKQLQESFADKNVAVLIVNKDEAADKIRTIYGESAPGMTVVIDDKAEISKAYGVSPVPFCFVIDRDGKIIKRMPYTMEAATDAINIAFGITSGALSPSAAGAG